MKKEIVVGVSGAIVFIICAVIVIVILVCIGIFFFGGSGNSTQTNIVPTVYIDPEVEKNRKIEVCNHTAEEVNGEDWIRYCEVNNIQITKKDGYEEYCEIPISQANVFNSQLARAKELCISRYK